MSIHRLVRLQGCRLLNSRLFDGKLDMNDLNLGWLKNMNIRSSGNALKMCSVLRCIVRPVIVMTSMARVTMTAFALFSVYLPGIAHADCIEDGGTDYCRPPVVSDWKLGYCYEYTDFPYMLIAQCRSYGGTPDGIYGDGCDNPGPLTEANLLDVANKFENYASNNPSCHIVSDTGWGQSISSQRCWAGSPVYQNGILVQDFRVLTPNCIATLDVNRIRSFSCPIGYTLQTLPSGEKVCKRPIECCSTSKSTLFPILTGSGVKRLTENDYESPVAGGVSFTRYYHSMYFFAPRAATGNEIRDMGSVWRSNYNKHIYAVTGSAYVSAALTYPSGEVQYFDANGNALIDYGHSTAKLITTAQGYQLHNSDDSVEIYDSTGRLLSIQSRNSVTQTMVYADGTDGSTTGHGGNILDASGNPTSVVIPAGWLLRVTDSFGRALTFGYDLYQRIVKVTLPDSSAISYTYDANNNLSVVTEPDGAQRSYLYNEQVDTANAWLPNALTGIIDESNTRYMTYFYDGSGRAVGEVSSSAGTNTNHYQLSYDANSLITTETDPLGAVHTLQYQKSNHDLLQLVSETQPSATGSGTVTASKTYDANGNVASKTDFNGNVTTYSYDLSRNLEISRTEASGTANARTTTTQWHPIYNLPTLISVYAGNSASGTPIKTTSFSYDSQGNLLNKTETDPATNTSRTWIYTYNSYGQVLTVDGPRTDVNDVTTYTYYDCNTGNECGQVHTIANAVGQTTTYTSYNANGQPLSITDANGQVTTLTYDARQRLSSRTVGTETTTFDYWPTGQLKKVTLPDGSYLSYTYDAAHRLTAITDSAGNNTHYTLDAMGNHTNESTYDANGVLALTRSKVYDLLGRLYQDIGAANQTTTYSYDNEGNPLSALDTMDHYTQYHYDALNRLSSVIDPASQTTQYGYNNDDSLISVTDPKGLTTSYSYSGLGDLSQQSSPDTSNTTDTYDSAGNLKTSTDANGSTVTYSYDALNRVTQAVYSDQTINYTYDQNTNGKGHLTSVSDASGSTAFAYTSEGRIANKTQITGSVTKSIGYSYNAAGQLIQLTTPSGQVINYTYSNGKVNSISVNGTLVINQISYTAFGAISGWQWGNGATATRQYNTDGQLTQLSDAGDTTTYAFNPDGSIATVADDNEVIPAFASGEDTFTNDAASNKLNSISGAVTRSYTYDSDGHTLSDGSRTFTYNAAGRLVTATNNSITTAYSYNALGQRVEKSNTTGTTYFAYDEAGHLLGEYDQAGNLIQELVWLNDIPVATIRTDQSGGSVGVFYIHTDHLNAPAKITRPSDNAIIWRWDHDPYGNGTPNQDPDGNGLQLVFNLRFPGQYYDAEMGLYYNWNRYYDQSTGKYISSDPIGLAGGQASTYAYVNGNPISLVDQLGLTWKSNNEFFWDWWNETGASERDYGPNDFQTQEMMTSAAADYMMDKFKEGGCKDIQKAGYSTARGFWDTGWRPWEWGSTAFQVGGFVWSAVNVGNGQVRFRVYNQASLYSFFYHAPGVPHKSRGGGFPYGGNINQKFEWTRLSPCGCTN